MRETQKQNCPLCEKPAEFEFRDHRNRKHFWCNTCVEFQISRSAENRLASSVAEWRSQYSEKAKQSNEIHVWVITSVNTLKQEGVANEVLNGEYILRSKLPSAKTGENRDRPQF
jgi:hypothetical protein